MLAITSVRTIDGQLREASSVVTLSADATREPTGFGDPPIYLSASITTSGKLGSFGIALVYSDDPGVAPELPPPSVSYSASARADLVPAPDCAIDTRSLILQTDVHDVVLAAQGEAVLSASATLGLSYAIVPGRLASFDEIDAAYLRRKTAFTEVVPASAFLLIGSDLSTPQLRTLIIAREVSEVRSYQVFVITFAPHRAP